jgi:hypothetical protein
MNTIIINNKIYLLIPFLLMILLSSILINKKYIVIIINKSDSPIYFCGPLDVRSNGIYNNEKIYHVTLTIDYNPSMFEKYDGHPDFNIHSKITKQTIKISRIKGNINNYNYLYKGRTEPSISSIENNEFVSDIHFIFFFTRQPYANKTYNEYIETMKKNGYAVTGKLVRNFLFFTINDIELQVNENAISDLLSFIRMARP